ncbi:MAG: hypothetical protein RL417_1515 [Pseudomonadota bacterium]|jgi:hypothetical protein
MQEGAAAAVARSFVEEDMRGWKRLCGVVVLAFFGSATVKAETLDSLPSWNRVEVKEAITQFVSRVTKDSSPDFVPVGERIAVFDNDGTLWPEQPMYFQLLFALDRVRELAPRHPEWREREPFAALLKGDVKRGARRR